MAHPWPRVLGVVAVAWSVVAAAAGVRAALRVPPDSMTRLESEFRAFIPDLPTRGEVGYLEPYQGGNEDAVKAHYAAQYALAPRVVVSRTGPEFVVVADGTERPGGDPRLTGYVAVAQTRAGHRLFRRFPTP